MVPPPLIMRPMFDRVSGRCPLSALLVGVLSAGSLGGTGHLVAGPSLLDWPEAGYSPSSPLIRFI